MEILVRPHSESTISEEIYFILREGGFQDWMVGAGSGVSIRVSVYSR